MKKTIRIISLLLAGIVLLSLVACSPKKTDGDDTPEVMDGLLAIQPEYVGETVSETTHTFKKSDFKLTAVFKNNVSRTVDDYTYEEKGMAAGVYVITFSYGGVENDLYVPVDIDFYNGK